MDKKLSNRQMDAKQVLNSLRAKFAFKCYIIFILKIVLFQFYLNRSFNCERKNYKSVSFVILHIDLTVLSMI